MIKRVAMGKALLAIFLPCAMLSAQSQLPAPSRTIYKCVVKGTVSYSDEPCAGAQRLDATPTSGVTHLSGSTKTGKDVANEIYIEQHAKAFQPLTGMNGAQLTREIRRNGLDASVQRECRQLEPAILGLEHEERRADAATIKPVQQDLLTLRKRYKTLAC